MEFSHSFHTLKLLPRLLLSEEWDLVPLRYLRNVHSSGLWWQVSEMGLAGVLKSHYTMSVSEAMQLLRPITTSK